MIAVALAAALAAAAPNDGVPAREWRDGPVRLLLTDEEYRRFGRLETTEARGAYVARFWRRLDPDPGTPENEARARFNARVAQAEARFGDDRPPGWRSDRGRIWVLLGEPDAVEQRAGDPDSISRETWVYQGVPPVRIVFWRGTDGEYRFEPARPAAHTGWGQRAEYERLRLLLETRRAMTSGLHTVEYAFAQRMLETMTPPADAPPAPWQPGAEPSTPTPEGVSSGELDGGGDGAVRDGVYYFQTAEGSVLALIAIAMSQSATGPDELWRASAWLSDEEAREGSDRRVLLEPVAAAGRTLHVGRAVLEPGRRYRLRVAVTAADRATMLVRTRRIVAPELGTGGLASSSLVPAESFGPAPDGGPFAVGSESVVPRPEALFHRGETLRLYLQLYGAATGGAGRPRVDVTYRFERKTTRGWKRQSSPLTVREASGASLGLALPVGDWPEGDYRCEVELRDRVAGRTVRAQESFRIR